jgi:hypothetical protein
MLRASLGGCIDHRVHRFAALRYLYRPLIDEEPIARKEREPVDIFRKLLPPHVLSAFPLLRTEDYRYRRDSPSKNIRSPVRARGP